MNERKSQSQYRERSNCWVSCAVVLGIALAASQIGCGSLFYGRHQTVNIRTYPRNATVTVYPSLEEHSTPAKIDLARTGIYTLRITREGYSPETVILDRVEMLNRSFIMIFAGLGIGGLVDISTGAYYDIVPSDVSINLKPITSSRTEDDETDSASPLFD